MSFSVASWIFQWLAVLIVSLYLYLKFVTFTYWKRKNVPHEKPIVPFGNTWRYITNQVSMGELMQHTYDKFKKFPYHGVYSFHEPNLIVSNLDLINLITIKDFQYFQNRMPDDHIEFEPILRNLFFERNKKWRNNRNKISPAFTSRRIKEMFHHIKNVGKNLQNYCTLPAKYNEVLDFKDLAARFTTDIIASIAYGCECNSLENPNHEFRIYGRKIFDVNPVKILLCFFAPIILRITRMRPVAPDVSVYFNKIFNDVVAYRQKNNVVQNDFVDLLIELMKYGYIKEQQSNQEEGVEKESEEKVIENVNIEFAAAQAFVFFAAGYETSSSTITYCLYQLALNPEIQETVRLEIKSVISNYDDLNYDSIAEMSYLHKVLFETIRMYPPVPLLSRVCLKDYKIPNSDFVIPEGTRVTIPVLAIHNDSDIYPNPEKFDPERFNNENNAQRHSLAFLGFGEGPRVCIGKRFALIQTKVMLIQLLLHYKISTCEKTEIPIKHNSRTFTLAPENGLYLKIEPL